MFVLSEPRLNDIELGLDEAVETLADGSVPSRVCQLPKHRKDLGIGFLNLLGLELLGALIQGSKVAETIATLDNPDHRIPVGHEVIVIATLVLGSLREDLDIETRLGTEEVLQHPIADVRGIFQGIMHKAGNDPLGINDPKLIDQDESRCPKVLEIANGATLIVELLAGLPTMGVLGQSVSNLNVEKIRGSHDGAQTPEEGSTVFGGRVGGGHELTLADKAGRVKTCFWGRRLQG